MFICTECYKQYEHINAFLSHSARTHKITSEQLYKKLNNIVDPPFCKCGCGTIMEFHTFSTGYYEYKRGHRKPTQEQIDKLISKESRAKSAESYRQNLASGKTVREKKEIIIDSSKEFKCPICPLSYDKLISLSIHYRSGHKLTARQLYIDFYLVGKEPVCACGCNGEVKFLDISRGFSEYQWGHAAKVSGKNNWGNNPKAFEKSLETRKEMWENDYKQ